MEVLTALGLATNVVQFVDFASKIVSQAVKIYRAQGTQDESSEHLTPVDLLTLSYADEPNPEFSVYFPLGKLSVEQANARADSSAGV
jgi:hypothetical protein